MSLAPYACHPEASLGRVLPESESSLRSVYQRDRDRIVHSIPFRRLEYKTQVFVNFEGDHFRTRLTHSLEVAQIGPVLGTGAARERGSDRDAGAGPRSRPQRVRACGRDGAGRGFGGLRRVRPQPADLPHRHPTGAALRGLRWVEPHPRDARGTGQARWARDAPGAVRGGRPSARGTSGTRPAGAHGSADRGDRRRCGIHQPRPRRRIAGGIPPDRRAEVGPTSRRRPSGGGSALSRPRPAATRARDNSPPDRWYGTRHH